MEKNEINRNMDSNSQIEGKDQSPKCVSPRKAVPNPKIMPGEAQKRADLRVIIGVSICFIAAITGIIYYQLESA